MDESEARMEELREGWDEVRTKISEIEDKLADIRKQPSDEGGDGDRTTGGEGTAKVRSAAASRVQELAGRLAVAMELVGGNEQAHGALAEISTKFMELGGILQPGERDERREQWVQQRPCDGAMSDGRADGAEAKGMGKGGRSGDDGTAARAKWARRGTKHQREETDGAQGTRTCGEGARHGNDAVAAAAAAGAPQQPAEGGGGAERGDLGDQEAKGRRNRVLDLIRGRLLVEKNRLATEQQAAAIKAGTMLEPHLWTEDQLQANRKGIEESNRAVDAEAERRLAEMSDEQVEKALGADGFW
jgi:hypothetical protein